MVNFLGSSVVKKSKGLAHGTSGWQAADRVKKTGQTLEHFKGILKRTYSGDSTQGSSVALTPFAVPPTTRVKKTGQPYTEHFSTTREGGYQECLGLQKCLKNSKLSLKKDVRFKGVQPVLNMTNCEAVEDQSIQVTPADPPQVRSVRCDKKTRSRVKVIPPIDPSANRAPLERRGCGDITPSNVFSSLKVVAPLDPIQAVVRARSPDYGYCTPPHTYSPTIPSSERYVDIPQNLEPALEVPGVPIAPDSENVIIIIDSPIKDPLGDFPALDPIQDTIRQQSLDCGDYSIPYTCLPTSPNSEQGADIFQNLKQVPLVPDIPTARASEPVIIIIDSPVKEPIVNPPLKEPVVNPPVKEPIIVNSDSHIKLACEEFIYASVICRLNDPPKPLDLSSTGPNGVNKRMCAVNNFQKLDNKPLSPRHTFKHVNTSAARVTVPCYKRGDTAKRLFDVDVLNSEKGKHLPGIQKKPLYNELASKIPHLKFVEGLPNSLNDDHLLPPNLVNMIIVDDLMMEGGHSSEIEKAFTQYSHHRNLSICYIVQNLFYRGKGNRSITLNASYIVLFKNPRDKHQLTVLARQMYPGNTRFFMEAFEDATLKPYGYLLVDLKTNTLEDYRLRTGVFPPDIPVVYVQKTSRKPQ
ncbi:uncharacterized protein [Ambystoma mexicanum]|uniref:uncharacterized protein n=1 Tax=Ambystoma mexicanum TaxID=8296 RepID=UPI0037E860BE